MYIEWRGAAEIAAAISQIERPAGSYLFIMLAAAHIDDVDGLVDHLNAEGVPFFGAVFPRLIIGANLKTEGLVVEHLPVVGEVATTVFDGEEIVWDTPLPDRPLAGDGETLLAMVFVDFWSRHTTALLDQLFDVYAGHVQYFGGGAGTGERSATRCLFTSRGAYGSGAMVALLSVNAVLALRHGWERVFGPLVATQSEDNAIAELNWQNAAEVYRQVVSDLEGRELPDDELVGRTKRHALAIYHEGQEDVIRDPVAITEEGALICLSDVPENSVLHVSQGVWGKLVESAAQAVDEGVHAWGERSRHPICIALDCYSRTMLPGGTFEQELVVARGALVRALPEIEFQGALALGEIASDGKRLPDFHNKTFTVGLFDV